VYVTGSDSTFNMRGGRVQGSEDSGGYAANTAATGGAAIYNNADGTTAVFGTGGGNIGGVAYDLNAAIDTTDDTIRAPR